MTEPERREYLKKLEQILPESKAFTDWLRASGELPPDFDALPRSNALPDPLRFMDGRPMNSAAAWPERRAEIRAAFERWVIGRVPPRPAITRVEVITDQRSGRCRIVSAKLAFGPRQQGQLHVELMIPDADAPSPVFLTPGPRAWAQQAVQRGYLAVVYAGSDQQDDTRNFAELFPGYDFSQLAQRALAASLALDYVLTRPEADRAHIAIAGHSRDGKQAAIAAALDERITGVILSSSGAGGALPYRAAGEKGMGEGIEAITRAFPQWFHPRLRFFSGREDRLPVDANLLVALAAPRACLISYALNDGVEGVWGDERCYLSAARVYGLLGQPQRLGLLSRPGGHGIAPAVVEEYFDWLDIQFGRSHRTWTSTLVDDYDFEQWRKLAGNVPAAPPSAAAAVRWALGEAPPRVASLASPRRAPAVPDELTASVLKSGGFHGWRQPECELASIEPGVRFGRNVTGDLYLPADIEPSTRLPVAIWLHAYGSANGYWWPYRGGLHPILALVQAGYAVFAFDQTGFGRRIQEAQHFSERYSAWSAMGRMVDDTRAAVEWLATHPRVDTKRTYLFGYSLGGTLALYTAALEPRVAGVISICGFTPMRAPGGLAPWAIERGLLPRLGLFAGKEAELPYDFKDLLTMISPRPALIVQPQLDRDADTAAVRAAVQGVPGVSLHEPWDYNRLPDKLQNWIINRWMVEHLR